MSSGWIEIVFLAGIAAFVIFQLYRTLGKRTGNEQTPFDPLNQRERIDTRRTPANTEDKVVPMPRPRTDVARAPSADTIEAKLPPGSAVALGIIQLRQADRDFSADGFLSGAKVAHEII